MTDTCDVTGKKSQLPARRALAMRARPRVVSARSTKRCWQRMPHELLGVLRSPRWRGTRCLADPTPDRTADHTRERLRSLRAFFRFQIGDIEDLAMVQHEMLVYGDSIVVLGTATGMGRGDRRQTKGFRSLMYG